MTSTENDQNRARNEASCHTWRRDDAQAGWLTWPIPGECGERRETWASNCRRTNIQVLEETGSTIYLVLLLRNLCCRVERRAIREPLQAGWVTLPDINISDFVDVTLTNKDGCGWRASWSQLAGSFLIPFGILPCWLSSKKIRRLSSWVKVNSSLMRSKPGTTVESSTWWHVLPISMIQEDLQAS